MNTNVFLVNGVTQIAYLCDGMACSECSGDLCHHTTDVNHAINFRSIDGLFIEKSEYDNIDHTYDPPQLAFTLFQYPSSIEDQCHYKLDLSPNISLLRCIDQVLSSKNSKHNGTITIYAGDDYDFNNRLAYYQYEDGSLSHINLMDLPMKWLSDTVVQANCQQLNNSMNFIFRISKDNNKTEE